MAQSGFHGIIGTALGRMVRKDSVDPGTAVLAKSLAFGLLVGNIAPDLDLIPLAITFLWNPALAMRMHRTATHSIVVIGLVTLAGRFFSTTKGAKSFFTGLGLGALTHTLVDVLVWFSGVDILWPLGSFGIPSRINLWKNVTIGRLPGNLLGAADFLAFGLFYTYLLRLGRRYETNVTFLPVLKRLAAFQFIAFGVYSTLAFFISRALFEIAQYALFVVVCIPMTWYVVAKTRPTVERMAVFSIDSR